MCWLFFLWECFWLTLDGFQEMSAKVKTKKGIVGENVPMCFNETQNSEVLLFILPNSVSSDVKSTWDCFLYPTCRLTSQSPLNLCGLVFTFIDLGRTVAERNPSITTWDV